MSLETGELTGDGEDKHHTQNLSSVQNGRHLTIAHYEVQKEHFESKDIPMDSGNLTNNSERKHQARNLCGVLLRRHLDDVLKPCNFAVPGHLLFLLRLRESV